MNTTPQRTTTPIQSTAAPAAPAPEPVTYRHNQTEGSPGELHDKIQATRSRLDDTFDLLIDQLSPSHLLDNFTAKLGFGGDGNGQGKAKAKEGCRRAYKALSRQVRTHPGPTLLLGAGLVWMMLDDDDEPFSDDDTERRQLRALGEGDTTGRIIADDSFIGAHPRDRSALEHDDEPSFKDRLSGAASSAAHKVSSAADKVKSAARSKASSLKDSARGGAASIKDSARSTKEHASEWKTSAAERTHKVSDRLSHKLREGYEVSAQRYDKAMDNHPLAVAAGALALGLLGALALPRTRHEDEWVGDRSDELKETAKEKGHEFAESAKTVAEKTKERVVEEAKEAGFTRDNLREKAKEVAHRAGEVAESAKKEATETAKEEKSKLTHETENKSSSSEDKSDATNSPLQQSAFSTSPNTTV